MPVSTFISHTERECSLVIDSRIIHTPLMPTYNLIKPEWKLSLYVYPKTNGVIFLHEVGLSSESRSANTFGNTSSDICFVCALCSFCIDDNECWLAATKCDLVFICLLMYTPRYDGIHVKHSLTICKKTLVLLCAFYSCVRLLLLNSRPGKVNHYNFVHTILGNNSLNQYQVSYYLGFVWHKSLQSKANENC